MLQLEFFGDSFWMVHRSNHCFQYNIRFFLAARGIIIWRIFETVLFFFICLLGWSMFCLALCLFKACHFLLANIGLCFFLSCNTLCSSLLASFWVNLEDSFFYEMVIFLSFPFLNILGNKFIISLYRSTWFLLVVPSSCIGFSYAYHGRSSLLVLFPHFLAWRVLVSSWKAIHKV